MGNYNNYICDNYYCHSVSFKPEWLSENSWTIKYKYLSIQNELKNSSESISDNLYEIIKPYIIEKGILKIKKSLKNNLLLSKKLLINFDELRNIIIPINFKYNLNNNSKINIYIIFSSNNLSNNFENNNEKDLLLNLDKESFYINLILLKRKFYLSNSFEQNIIKYNIKSNKIYSFITNIENNFNMLLINETINNIFDKKYLYNFTFNENKEYYINLYIKTENNLTNNEYIELNFE
jgi:hypothetical protein